MARRDFEVTYRSDKGLVLNWRMPNGLEMVDVPVRVDLRGHSVFYVWSAVDSGEEAPVWADPNLNIGLFGASSQSEGIEHAVEAIVRSSDIVGYRATARSARAQAVLDFLLEDGELRVTLRINNPMRPGGKHLPLCESELRFEDLSVGAGGHYLNAHAYGGKTHGYGKLAELEQLGVPFVHGCIGQAVPLVFLHDEHDAAGVQFEMMMDGRPIAWLAPGRTEGKANWRITWGTDRLLEPGGSHAYGGSLGILPYTGNAVAQIRRWRDSAASRYGLTSPKSPKWVRHATGTFFNMNPDQAVHGFKSLSDSKCRELLKRWSEMGITALYSVSDNHVGINWLSPFDYEPRPEVGGVAGEKQMLDWVHEFGMKIYLWVTTVGVDRNCRLAAEHPDWFTRRTNGGFFYAWDSHPPHYLGYAPDADPTSRGWRDWLKGQVKHIVERGFDGIFVDGLIPRASNHAKWTWPGEGRNGVQDQVMEIAEYVRELGRQTGRELVTVVEDESLMMQATCDVTTGRYEPLAPHLKKAHWDHGMGGGPASVAGEPSVVPPEMARHYLLVRYASLLPGAISQDGIGGYEPGNRPWSVQSLMAGVMCLMDGGIFESPSAAIEADEGESKTGAETAYSRKVREQWLQLVQFSRREELIHEAPLSIEGVAIEGDAAVVGILRPGEKRAILAVIQFADRDCDVAVSLAPPCDVPEVDRERAGTPEAHTWSIVEILRSADEQGEPVHGTLAPSAPLRFGLAPFGFRIFEMRVEE